MQPYIPKAESESAPIDASRAPNWRKWKYVHDIVLWRAVALSLNIAPEKVRRNPRRWRGRFAESEEFLDRLFVAEHNLQELKPLNFAAMHYDDADPVVPAGVRFARGDVRARGAERRSPVTRSAC